MDGSYVLTDDGGTTTVTHPLAVDTALPMITMLRRKAGRTIVDGSLPGLERQVEA